MHLVSIEPHPDYGRAFELHAFQCGSCGRMQSYMLRRRPAAAAPAIQQVVPPHARLPRSQRP
jgi:hypothetical protein